MDWQNGPIVIRKAKKSWSNQNYYKYNIKLTFLITSANVGREYQS